MNADELYTLLNDLPDDYVTAAAGTHRHSRRPLYVIVPAVAACITLLIAAAVYPKLRTQQPERREDPVYTETTAAAFTTALPEEQEPPAFTVSQTGNTAAGTVRTQPGTQTQTAEPSPQAGTGPVRQEHVTEQEDPNEEHEAVTTYDPYMKVTVTETQVTTVNPGRQTSGAEAELQTVPYLLSKSRITVPWNPSGGDPATVPVPETMIGTELPTTGHTDPLETICVPITTTTRPEPQQESEREPEPPLIETDGRYCIITPCQPFADVTLTGGVLDSEGRLHLELTGLNSPGGAGMTTQIILTLPDEIAARIWIVTAHITAEKNETAYTEIAGGTPVILDNTGQGG